MNRTSNLFSPTNPVGYMNPASPFYAGKIDDTHGQVKTNTQQQVVNVEKEQHNMPSFLAVILLVIAVSVILGIQFITCRSEP